MSNDEPHSDLNHDLDLIIERLENRFESIDPDTVDTIVHQCAAHFIHAPVQSFVSVLTEKLARQQLRSLVPA